MYDKTEKVGYEQLKLGNTAGSPGACLKLQTARSPEYGNPPLGVEFGLCVSPAVAPVLSALYSAELYADRHLPSA